MQVGEKPNALRKASPASSGLRRLAELGFCAGEVNGMRNGVWADKGMRVWADGGMKSSSSSSSFPNQTFASNFRARSKSFSVRPPSSWVVNVRVTLFQRMSISG